jgi:2-haloacid dehalogenase
MTLDQLLRDFGVQGLDEAEIDWLNRAWHCLKPWPDVISGLTRVRRKFTIGALSNGNVSLLSAMAKSAGLPWDCIFSAELARHYKPDAETWLKTAELLSLSTSQVMLVAAHNDKLVSAAEQGYATTFVGRPAEYGIGVDEAATVGAEIVACEPREGLRGCVRDERDAQPPCRAQPANADD